MRIGRVLWVQVRLGACKHIYTYMHIARKLARGLINGHWPLKRLGLVTPSTRSFSHSAAQGCFCEVAFVSSLATSFSVAHVAPVDHRLPLALPSLRRPAKAEAPECCPLPVFPQSRTIKENFRR